MHAKPPRHALALLFAACFGLTMAGPASAQSGSKAEVDLAFQLPENPPMQLLMREAPPLPEPTEDFEVRDGFTLIDSLDDFRAAIKRDNQKIRMKPGHYIAEKVDPPVTFTKVRPAVKGKAQTATQEQVFAITGSDNHLDLRGVVFTIPSSVKDQLTRKTHMADNWRVNGANNIIEGAYFRTEVDKPYPTFFSGGNLFEVANDGNTFLDCTFHVKGSSPFGYSDYYGKGRGAFTKLDKHSFMSLEDANNTTLRGCKIYNHAFGHAIHFHQVDGVLIEDCFFSGALRETKDILREKAGLAKEHGFKIMFRGERPIPRKEVIPITEDAIRSYNNVYNIVVRDTTIERQRGCVQLLCPGGDLTLERVTVLEAGDFSFDVSTGRKGKTVMKDCVADIAYNPVFNLTRGEVPYKAFYEITVINSAEGTNYTPRSGLGKICGEKSTFIFHDGTTRRIPRKVFMLTAGGKQPLIDSTVTNYTTADIVLEKNVKNCTIRTAGRVIDRGQNNKIIKIKNEKKKI